METAANRRAPAPRRVDCRGEPGSGGLARLLRAALLAVLAVILVGCGPFLDPANLQDQPEQPAGLLGQGRSVGQAFVPRCDGLSAIDLQVAIYPDLPPTNGALLVRLWTATAPSASPGRLLAEERFAENSLQPNQWIRLLVPPVDDSRGRTFRIEATTTDPRPSPVTLWATSHPAGPEAIRFVGHAVAPGTLIYRVFCEETPVATAKEAIQTIGRSGLLWPAALLLCLLPGVAVARWLDHGESDLTAFLGLAAGWSVLIAPLALAIATPARLGVVPEIALGIVATGLIARFPPRWRLDPWSILAAISALVALGIRLVDARALVAPMWGDPVQHSYVAKLILENRGVPATYGRLVPDQIFDYHFGFQTLAAAAGLVSGSDPAQAVLATGQILDGLICLATYRLGRDLTGSRPVGAVAALLVGMVTTQPAYFVSWGRYPELAALVAWPAAFGALQRALDRPAFANLALAASATAALVLVHPRVAIFLAALGLGVIVAGSAATWRSEGSVPASMTTRLRQTWSFLGHRLGRFGVVGVLSLGLLLPWATRLWQAHAQQVIGPFRWQPIDFPIGLATAGNDRWILLAAAVSWVVGLAWRPCLSVAFGVWGLLVIIVANPATFHLPVHLFVNNGSIAIALFLPGAILVGSLVDLLTFGQRLIRWPEPVSRALPLVLLAFGLTQAPSLTTVANPYCLLLRPDDLAAIAWVRAATPPNARFLINGFMWMDSIWMGSDAGYWLPVLADRSTSLPPLFYAVGPPDQVDQINQVAAAVSRDAHDAPALARLARRIGASYVFVGSRGGAMEPSALAASAWFRVVYRAGGAWVLEVVADGPASSSTETGKTPAARVPPSDSNAAGLRSTTPG